MFTDGPRKSDSDDSRAPNSFGGGCCDGMSYHDTLKSDNIENAKREFEAWYKQYLMCCVERLEDALAAAKEEYENFLQYHKEV